MRSDYLDNLAPDAGEMVRCKCDMMGDGFTPERLYQVLPDTMVRNDQGDIVRPSARFYRDTG